MAPEIHLFRCPMNNNEQIILLKFLSTSLTKTMETTKGALATSASSTNRVLR